MIFSVLVLCTQLSTVEYDVRDVTLMLVRLRSSVSRADWASIPKVVGLIPTVARHIFQACPVWIYTQRQSNIM